MVILYSNISRRLNNYFFKHYVHFNLSCNWPPFCHKHISTIHIFLPNQFWTTKNFFSHSDNSFLKIFLKILSYPAIILLPHFYGFRYKFKKLIKKTNLLITLFWINFTAWNDRYCKQTYLIQKMIMLPKKLLFSWKHRKLFQPWW